MWLHTSAYKGLGKCAFVHAQFLEFVFVFGYVYMYIYMHICACIYVSVYVYVYVHVYVHVYVLYIHSYVSSARNAGIILEMAARLIWRCWKSDVNTPRPASLPSPVMGAEFRINHGPGQY